MAGNKELHKAKKEKNDEFYTQLSDIEYELKHYREHFKDKVIFCNCDDPEYSNFWQYFNLNFEFLGLKKLIATHYQTDVPSYMLEMYRDGMGVHTDIRTLKGNGDFRSEECIELLKEADIVVTNPPFSLLRVYIGQLISYNKKFIIIGTQNAITYKEIFPLIKENKLWLGYGFRSGNAYFSVRNPKDYADGVYDKNTGLVKFRNCCWFTNLDVSKRHEELILYKTYNPTEYLKYDNYDAINVNKVAEIPYDYDGVMGVPITFLQSYNPEQFEIIKFRKGNDEKDLSINGKCPYFRILIKRRMP